MRGTLCWRLRQPTDLARQLPHCAALAAALVASSAAAQDAELASAEPLPASESQAEPDPFAAAFEGVIEPLPADLIDIDPLVPATAVDLDTFEPPRGARVIRSLGSGIASYYGRRFHGRLTANGERFDMGAMTAAHKTLPFGSLVRVTNPRNGKTVTVRINDRGPFIPGREIDLSRGAAERIGMIQQGHQRVELALVAN